MESENVEIDKSCFDRAMNHADVHWHRPCKQIVKIKTKRQIICKCHINVSKQSNNTLSVIICLYRSKEKKSNDLYYIYVMISVNPWENQVYYMTISFAI